jgi:hypothetical protein
MNAITTPQTLSDQSSTRRRWGRRLLGGSAALLLLVATLAGFMIWWMNRIPADLDTATTRLSAQGIFRGAYHARLEPLSINQIHAWSFHLETDAGQPLDGAAITVDGGMPQHGHGLPTAPQVTTALGNGDYLVEGMKFNMPGWWVVNFHISANGQRDSMTFNLILK